MGLPPAADVLRQAARAHGLVRDDTAPVFLRGFSPRSLVAGGGGVRRSGAAGSSLLRARIGAGSGVVVADGLGCA